MGTATVRRHSCTDGWRTVNEEKECNHDGSGEVAIAAERTARRGRRMRHTMADTEELRTASTHFAARHTVSEQYNSRQKRQPLWPELLQLQLFPPSLPDSDTSEGAASLLSRGENGAVDSDDTTGSLPPLLAAALDSLVVAADRSPRVASYRAAVPNTTLSFSVQSESRLHPDYDRRYRQTQAAIAAHRSEEGRYATPPVGRLGDGATSVPTAVAMTSCCVTGPCGARSVDDVALLAAWRELLDSSEQAAHWSSEDELAALEAHFQSAVRGLVWRGIPHSIRRRAWLRLLRDKMPARDMAAYYAAMHERVRRVQQQQHEQQGRQAAGLEDSCNVSAAGTPLWSSFADIDKDVHRTLPSLWLFRTADGTERLRRLLLAYSMHCPLVGYCQGLNFIAGSLLAVCEGDEVAAFSLLTAMVDARSGYYSASMAACMVDTQVLSDLCSYFEPELCALLSSHGLSLSNFCSSWLICLFCNTPLNVYDTFRVWDVLHVLGDEVLFRCGLSLLRHAHSRIAAIRSAEELMLLFLQQLGDVQHIEPVMQHMYAEWLAEPLLSHSIAALRQYHRVEITAEHSTLPASTIVRLSERVAFNEDELQRLWQIFIRPDPWLTISTHCIHSLVHFRYSFCAAVFHPDTSAQFKGRGLILPLNQQTEAVRSSALDWPKSAASVEQPNGSTELTCGMWEQSATHMSSTPSLPRAASDGFEGRSVRDVQRSLTAFYDPNHHGASHETAKPDDALTVVHEPGALVVASATSSSPSSSHSAADSSFLSHVGNVTVPFCGGGLRSLASTFVIPAASDETDSIFAHANSHNDSKHSLQGSYRSNAVSSRRPDHHSKRPPSHFPRQPVDVDLPFHAPSTTVPLSSPPLSPWPRSNPLAAAARVLAFAFPANNYTSGTSTAQHDTAGSKPAVTPKRPYGQQPQAGMSGSGGRSHPPHSLPTSFSAHRALLSATAALSMSTLPPNNTAKYAHLTLQRPQSSSTQTSPNSGPMSAPSELFSIAASTLLQSGEAADTSHGRRTFSSTTPLTCTLTAGDESADQSCATPERPSTSRASLEQPAHTMLSPVSLDVLPLCRPRLHSSPAPRVSTSAPVGLLSVSVGPSSSNMYACSDNVLARLFAMLDSSSRGVVDFDEFCFGVCLFKRYPRSARLRAMFAMCDVVGDGQVGRADFAAFVQMFDRLYHGKRASDADLQAFVDAAFSRAAPSQYINCPLFEQIVQLHPAISKFCRLDAASE